MGLFPLLREGGYRADAQDRSGAVAAGAWAAGAFVYQSCSGPSHPGASYGGELTLVPGELADPAGAPFDVRIEPFVLELPEVYF